MDLVQPRQAYLHYSQRLEQSSSMLRSFSVPYCPLTYDTSFNNDARKLNAETKRCCEKMDNCNVIPLQVIWQHHTRGRHFLQDSVQLFRVGTAVLTRNFKSALGMTEKQDLTAGHRSGNHRQHAYKGQMQSGYYTARTFTCRQHIPERDWSTVKPSST